MRQNTKTVKFKDVQVGHNFYYNGMVMCKDWDFLGAKANAFVVEYEKNPKKVGAKFLFPEFQEVDVER